MNFVDIGKKKIDQNYYKNNKRKKYGKSTIKLQTYLQHVYNRNLCFISFCLKASLKKKKGKYIILYTFKIHF